MSDTRLTSVRPRTRVAASVAIGAAVAMSSAFAVATPAAAADIVNTITFTPGPQESFTVPADATGLQVTVAGAQGSTRSQALQTGGAGGVVTLDLGTAYNGVELHVLVGGADRVGSGTNGTYLATDSEFVAIAGGGGVTGFIANGNPGTPLPGGAGGFASGDLDGADGTQARADLNFSGRGASGTTAGTPGYSPSEAGPPADVVSVPASVVDGVITPSSTERFLGSGGDGLASGGAARGDAVVAGLGPVRGAAGGGSSYLAPGLVPVSTGANAGPEGSTTRANGYITVTWSVPNPDDAVPAPVPADPGTTPPVTAPAADGTEELAATGAETPVAGYAAAALLLLGGAALLARRRLVRG